MRRVRLVAAGRADALVLVVDVGRRIERLLEAVGPVERARPVQAVGVADRLGDLDLALGRDLLADEGHREERRQVVRPDRLARCPGGAAARAGPAGRPRCCTRRAGSGLVEDELRLPGIRGRHRDLLAVGAGVGRAGTRSLRRATAAGATGSGRGRPMRPRPASSGSDEDDAAVVLCLALALAAGAWPIGRRLPLAWPGGGRAVRWARGLGLRRLGRLRRWASGFGGRLGGRRGVAWASVAGVDARRRRRRGARRRSDVGCRGDGAASGPAVGSGVGVGAWRSTAGGRGRRRGAPVAAQPSGAWRGPAAERSTDCRLDRRRRARRARLRSATAERRGRPRGGDVGPVSRRRRPGSPTRGRRVGDGTAAMIRWRAGRRGSLLELDARRCPARSVARTRFRTPRRKDEADALAGRHGDGALLRGPGAGRRAGCRSDGTRPRAYRGVAAQSATAVATGT